MNSKYRNFFSHDSVALRYARYRPYFHPLVIEKIKSHLGLKNPVGVALDVGCGTGQSTVALKEIAVKVIGVDISNEMLEVAEQKPGIEYIQSSAEDLSMFDDGSFDLVTTSMAIHWFDHKRFLFEANRGLKDDGWLIPYTNGFFGQMVGNDDFQEWNSQTYASKYPTPPRHSIKLSVELADEFGFSSFYAEKFQNSVYFSPEELSAYLTTQSNVIAAVEQGKETLEEVHQWLMEQTRSYFRAEKAEFIFGGSIWYFQKS